MEALFGIIVLKLVWIIGQAIIQNTGQYLKLTL